MIKKNNTIDHLNTIFPNSDKTSYNLDDEMMDFRYLFPHSILWNITYSCNLKCKHCLYGYSESDEMNYEQVINTLYKLRGIRANRINFSGGEPLLRENIIQILEQSIKLKFNVTLSSNGLLLTDKMLKKLGKIGVHNYQISIDGLEATHDEFRIRKGVFKITTGAIKKASEYGYNVIMSTTVTKQNISQIGDLLDLAVDLGASSFKLNGLMPVGRGKTNKEKILASKKMIKHLSLEMIKRKKELEGNIDVQLGPLYPWLCEHSSRPMVKGKKSDPLIRCSAGQNTLVISPDGTLSACPFLEQYPLGNLLYDDLYSIWTDNNGILGKFRNLHQSDIEGKCKDCQYVPKYCNGGCRAAALNETGNYYAEDPFCWRKPRE